MDKNYKTVKFFEQSNFPDEVRNAFHSYAADSHLGYCNGSSVRWMVGSVSLTDEAINNPEIGLEKYKDCYGEDTGEWMYIVDTYLYQNDCIDGEEVLILFSW